MSLILYHYTEMIIQRKASVEAHVDISLGTDNDTGVKFGQEEFSVINWPTISRISQFFLLSIILVLFTTRNF